MVERVSIMRQQIGDAYNCVRKNAKIQGTTTASGHHLFYNIFVFELALEKHQNQKLGGF